MALTPEQFVESVRKVKLAFPAELDDGSMAGVLAELTESYAEVSGQLAESAETITALEERNNKLRDYNEELFFKTGGKADNPDKEEETLTKKPEEPPAIEDVAAAFI